MNCEQSETALATIIETDRICEKPLNEDYSKLKNVKFNHIPDVSHLSLIHKPKTQEKDSKAPVKP